MARGPAQTGARSAGGGKTVLNLAMNPKPYSDWHPETMKRRLVIYKTVRVLLNDESRVIILKEVKELLPKSKNIVGRPKQLQNPMCSV